MNKKNPIENLKKSVQSKEVDKNTKSIFEQLTNTPDELNKSLPPVFGGQETPQETIDEQTVEFKVTEEKVCQNCPLFLKTQDCKQESEPEVPTEKEEVKVDPTKKVIKTIYHTIPNSGRVDR